jgi:hypothetical protein
MLVTTIIVEAELCLQLCVDVGRVVSESIKIGKIFINSAMRKVDS